jgi:hypothetical protein
MNPLTGRSSMGMRPLFFLVIVIGLALAAGADPAEAQGKRRKRSAQRAEKKEKKVDAKPIGDKKKKEKVFDFTGFELAGSVRMPQLLYFLDRAEEELERASLERRSFVPEMMKSLDEENL